MSKKLFNPNNNKKKKSDFDWKLNPVNCYEIRWFELKLKRISIT